MECLTYVLFVWYVKWQISDRAFTSLLKLLYAFFGVIGKQQSLLSNEIANFPQSLAGLLKFVQFNKQGFSKY